MIALRNILVANDLSSTTEAAFVCGRALAHACGATLHVLHVVDHVFVGPFCRRSAARDRDGADVS